MPPVLASRGLARDRVQLLAQLLVVRDVRSHHLDDRGERTVLVLPDGHEHVPALFPGHDAQASIAQPLKSADDKFGVQRGQRLLVQVRTLAQISPLPDVVKLDLEALDRESRARAFQRRRPITVEPAPVEEEPIAGSPFSIGVRPSIVNAAKC